VDTLNQILVTGLTLGAMYAMSTVGLSLVWGALGMLNLAHGVILAIGGYTAYWVIAQMGFPLVVGLFGAMAMGALLGVVMYFGIVRQMLKSKDFETNIIIATIGIAIALENLLLRGFGGSAIPQPIQFSGGFWIGMVYVPWQNAIILITAVVFMGLLAWFLQKSRHGRAIRATAQNRDAARLMGVDTGNVYIQVLALAGALAAISGIMLSSMTTLTPGMGADPMIKAFIICVVAGLGNVGAAAIAAFALGMIEAGAQFQFGSHLGFPTLLVIVIAVLIWRPYGLFGREEVERL